MAFGLAQHMAVNAIEDGEFGAHGARCLRGGSRSTSATWNMGVNHDLGSRYSHHFTISFLDTWRVIYTQCEFDDRRCHWILNLLQVEFCKALLATQNTCYIPCGSPKKRSTDASWWFWSSSFQAFDHQDHCHVRSWISSSYIILIPICMPSSTDMTCKNHWSSQQC